MDIKTFKKMLDLYGADLSRWEDADLRKAQDFMAESEKAAALYKDARELDEVLGMAEDHAPDPAILTRTVEKIDIREHSARGGKSETERQSLQIFLESLFSTPAVPVLAGVVVFLAIISGFIFQQSANISDRSAAQQDVEQFLAQLEQVAAEEELISILDVAANETSAGEKEIEQFLDTLFDGEAVSDDSPGQEDLWNILFENDTQQL